MGTAEIRSEAPVAARGGGGLPAVRRWNAGLGGLHLAQGVAMLALATTFALPVTSSFLTYDRAAGELFPDPRTLFELRIAPLVAAFLLLSLASTKQGRLLVFPVG
jgi:Heliorhodopsin